MEQGTRIIYLHAGLLALLLLLTLWAYWGVRMNPFHFDDALFLQSPQVSTPGDPWYLLKPSQSRQLTYLSFYWSYRLCGTRPQGYHTFNLLLHCLNVLGVYGFTLLVCRLKPPANCPDLDLWLPVLAAGIFALHPIQSEAVNYVYQRSTLLATFFSLAALITFLALAGSKRPGVQGAMTAIFMLLACLCKETALILPAVIALFTLVCPIHGSATQAMVRRSRVLILVLSLLMISGAAWVLYSLRQKGERTLGLGLIRESSGYLMSQAQVLASYLGLILWPSGLVIDHAFQPAPAASVRSLLCWILVVGLVAAFVWTRRTKPEVAFWGLAFIILLLPSSSIIPSADLMFEHRLYLPMVAGSALAGWFLIRLCRLALKRERARSAALLVLASIALAAYALAAKRRTYVWGDNVRLWSDAVEKVPGNARGHYNLAVAYLSVDRRAAYGEFQKTVALQPTHAAALYNLGWLEQAAGRTEAARSYYEAAIRADSGTWQAHQSLANLDLLQGRSNDAVREYEATIRLRPECWPAYLSLAALDIQLGNFSGALAILQRLLSEQPDLLEARYLKAYALAMQKSQAGFEEEIRFITSRDTGGVYAQRIRELRRYLDSSPAPK